MRQRLLSVALWGTLLGSLIGIDAVLSAQQTGRSSPRTDILVASGRSVAQTAAVGTVTSYAVSASADQTFEVFSNVNVTVVGSANFTVTVAYTDETNSGRTTTLNYQVVAGTIATAITTAGPSSGIPITIRAKAGTSITVATTGTFTGATYNVEAEIFSIPV